MNEQEQVCIDRAEYEELLMIKERVEQALARYDYDEQARGGIGFPRGEVAWAMASDLRPTEGERERQLQRIRRGT